MKSELDLFKKIPFQNQFEKTELVEHRPTSSISSGSTIEFEITTSPDEYLDTQNIFIEVYGNLTKQDGTAYAAGDLNKYSVINYGVNTIFDQLSIYLNGVLVSQSAKTYPYIAFMELLTQNDVNAFKTQLFAAGASTRFGDTNKSASTAEAIDPNLHKLVKQSKSFRLYGKLHGGIFKTDRLLISGVTMHLAFSRATDSFCLMGTAAVAGANPVAAVEPKLNLTKVSIYARKAKLTSRLLNDHATALSRARAIYPVRTPIVKVNNLPANQQSFMEENIFRGQLPSKIIFGLVRDTAYNGNYIQNPFAFKNFGCNYKAVIINAQSIPLTPYEPNFTANVDNYEREYSDFFEHLGCRSANIYPPIDYEYYGWEFCLTSFNLNSDAHNSPVGHHISLPKTGFLSIQLKFAATLTQALKLIVYGVFDNVIEIDSNRNVSVDITQ